MFASLFLKSLNKDKHLKYQLKSHPYEVFFARIVGLFSDKL